MSFWTDGTDLLATPLPGRWNDADGLRLVLTCRREHRLLGREVLLSGPTAIPKKGFGELRNRNSD